MAQRVHAPNYPEEEEREIDTKNTCTTLSEKLLSKPEKELLEIVSGSGEKKGKMLQECRFFLDKFVSLDLCSCLRH